MFITVKRNLGLVNRIGKQMDKFAWNNDDLGFSYSKSRQNKVCANF